MFGQHRCGHPHHPLLQHTPHLSCISVKGPISRPSAQPGLTQHCGILIGGTPGLPPGLVGRQRSLFVFIVLLVCWIRLGWLRVVDWNDFPEILTAVSTISSRRTAETHIKVAEAVALAW